TGAAMIGGDAVVAQYRALLTTDFRPPLSELELTPSELGAGPVDAGFSRRAAEPFDHETAALGSAAHKILQSGLKPSLRELQRQNLEDLHSVFESDEWKEVHAAAPERELPFMLHLRVAERDCSIRGRIDALGPGEVLRFSD